MKNLMNLKSTLILSVLAIFIGVQSAQAGILIDPYVGAGSHVSAFDAVSSGSSVSDSSNSASVFGARLGYSFLLLSAGIDYQKMTVDDTELTNTSLFVGFDLPILVRAWAEYFLAADGDSDFNSAYKFKDGYGVGIGFTGLPFVSLNLEIQNINYESELSGAVYDNATAATIFSVSFPINL